VIVVGEMRDPETMRIAVAAAETGHLVLSTLHTIDVASTISRISDSFPLERQNSIRQELAMALAAVHTQVLCQGREAARYPPRNCSWWPTARATTFAATRCSICIRKLR
jgi:twitching motility protein PilT